MLKALSVASKSVRITPRGTSGVVSAHIITLDFFQYFFSLLFSSTYFFILMTVIFLL